MASSAFGRLAKSLSTPQHDYRINTELFGQLDVDKIAKELELEKKGTQKGEKNQPASSSQVPDEVETSIQDKIESAKKTAHHLAENELFTYNERISNLDFEGHFAELRQAGPKAIIDIQTALQISLNDMFTRRHKLLDIENEFKKFRERNILRDRTAKVTTSSERVLRYLIIAIIVILETYFNGTNLAKTNDQGLLGGVFEAAAFAALNVGFSIIITIFGIKQIIKKGFLWKIWGILSLLAWTAVVFIINIFLAHYRETETRLSEGAGKQIMEEILSNPFSLSEVGSWVLFSIGVLFALITLVDVIKFSDIFPGYTAVQLKVDNEQADYKEEFERAVESLEEIKDQYHDDLDKIGQDLSLRRRELDTIMSNRARLMSLYYAHHDQLQRSSNALLSFYYEANRAVRKTNVPKRFDKESLLTKMSLSSGSTFTGRDAKKIKTRIDEAKDFLDEQLEKVHSEFSAGIEKFNNLDKLMPDK